MNFKIQGLIFLCFFLQSAQAQETMDTTEMVAPLVDTIVSESDATISIFEMLRADSISDVKLMTNFDSIEFYKIRETYQPATFSFTNKAGEPISLNIKVRTRGKMRKRVCPEVSLKLKFKKSDLKALGLSKENKYKLVCQCDKGTDNEQWLLKEYLAYKLYNQITENSYQAHLMNINYIDTSNGKERQRYGFIIENEEALAKRRGGKVIERGEFELSHVKRKQLIQMAVFQYMIGNTDWSVSFMHNIKLISDGEKQLVLSIPYDFDYSGLVDASYATPNPDLGIQSVTDRWFQANGCSENEILVHLQIFAERKEEIISMCKNFTLLNKRSHRHVVRFLSEFFETIENPKKVRRIFVK